MSNCDGLTNTKQIFENLLNTGKFYFLSIENIVIIFSDFLIILRQNF